VADALAVHEQQEITQMRDEQNPGSYPEKLEIQDIEDLPAFMKDPIMADAKVFQEKHNKKWVCETMALFKYQVEGAHQRLDEIKQAIGQLAQGIVGLQNFLNQIEQPPPSTDDDSDDWWKQGGNRWS
tara:strand:- start:23 stop:403 length:381 start_codon:yes stop_codon:yes gene_type:complete